MGTASPIACHRLETAGGQEFHGSSQGVADGETEEGSALMGTLVHSGLRTLGQSGSAPRKPPVPRGYTRSKHGMVAPKIVSPLWPAELS